MWLAGDLSGDLQGWTPEEYASLARARGLDFVAGVAGESLLVVDAGDVDVPVVDALGARGVGQPTVWVQAERRDAEAVATALRAGRVSASHLPPALGGPRLFASVADGRVCVCVEDGTGGCLRLLRDSAVVAEAVVGSPVSEHEFDHPGTGRVWAELIDRTGRTTARTAAL